MKTGCNLDYEVKTVSPIPINKEDCYIRDIKLEDQVFYPPSTTTYVVELTPELKGWIEEQYNFRERILKNLYQIMESRNIDPELDAYYNGIAKAISIVKGLS